MAFDWTTFFDQNSIGYLTSGPNVGRDHVAIHCPFCGSQDEGHHMSVSLKGNGWRCWRRPEHRGKSPAYLIAAILHIPQERARQLAGMRHSVPSDFLNQIRGHLDPPKISKKKRTILLPSEFKALDNGLSSSRPFLEYLRGRKYTDAQIANLTKRYGLRYATSGAYKYRVIFPVIVDGSLRSWTGRAINKSAVIRYRTLSDDPEKAKDEGYEPGIGKINDYLLFNDLIRTTDADIIFVCEGPFDALKVNVLGRKHGICATCVFTATPSDMQIEALHDILPRFKHRRFLLDSGTTVTAMRATMRMAGLDIGIAHLPNGYKDPGELELSPLLQIALDIRKRRG